MDQRLRHHREKTGLLNIVDVFKVNDSQIAAAIPQEHGIERFRFLAINMIIDAAHIGPRPAEAAFGRRAAKLLELLGITQKIGGVFPGTVVRSLSDGVDAAPRFSDVIDSQFALSPPMGEHGER